VNNNQPYIVVEDTLPSALDNHLPVYCIPQSVAD